MKQQIRAYTRREERDLTLWKLAAVMALTIIGSGVYAASHRDALTDPLYDSQYAYGVTAR
jgi:hypothetical protein